MTDEKGLQMGKDKIRTVLSFNARMRISIGGVAFDG